jgi:hypothetical protein
MERLAVGVIIGILLSIISVALFTAWQTVQDIGGVMAIFSLDGIVSLLGENFSWDLFSFFTSIASFSIESLLNPVFLAWLFVGIISGAIAKGVTRGISASAIVLVVNILLWFLLALLAGQDIASWFTTGLVSTLGGIAGAAVGSILGGLIGGAISGPYEEFY